MPGDARAQISPALHEMESPGSYLPVSPPLPDLANVQPAGALAAMALAAMGCRRPLGTRLAGSSSCVDDGVVTSASDGAG